MRTDGYERLSGLDHSFLHFETQNSYMHVASTCLFRGGSSLDGDGGIDIARARAHIASRLHLIPRYRQRLGYVPVTNDPIWVDDDRFDLEYHVRHSHLPHPGSDAQLKTLCARILERPLDRRRPLWEIWLIEGLEGGRFAMLSKVHHCMVDGIAGVDLLAALLNAAPDATVGSAEPWRPAPPPTVTRLLRDEVRRRTDASAAIVATCARALTPEARGRIAGTVGSLWGFVRSGTRTSGETPINRPIGPHRRVDWVELDLEQVKHVKRRLGGTLNDVVLATVAGAMRRLFLDRRAPVAGDFRVLIPVSVRAASERGETGNRVSAWLAPLPLGESRALDRFRAIRDTTAHHRDHRQERGPEVLTRTADWTTSLPLALAIGAIRRTRAFDLIVTNVPGPQLPLYLLDAEMIAAHPHVPLFENQGLGIALLSYAGRLAIGLVADWDVVPDVHRVAGWVEAAFAELRDAACGEPAPRARKRALQAVA
ncbi:MAG TPA: wax ester/triacylglycerol synthase family O-acyltransferase [Candidatus Binatia bacterium]|nr:wax ester/triacylglycerol synthase family O-acyltransferase [Candidatus Binatia bacterium]